MILDCSHVKIQHFNLSFLENKFWNVKISLFKQEYLSCEEEFFLATRITDINLIAQNYFFCLRT